MKWICDVGRLVSHFKQVLFFIVCFSRDSSGQFLFRNIQREFGRRHMMMVNFRDRPYCCSFAAASTHFRAKGLWSWEAMAADGRSALQNFHTHHPPSRQVHHGVDEVSHSRALSVGKNPLPTHPRSGITSVCLPRLSLAKSARRDLVPEKRVQ